MTAPGRPSASAVRNGGEATQRIAATARSDPRPVSREAANQTPIAAAGMATSQSSTMAKDGAQNVNDPSTASTPLNGSAAPTNPVPMSRQPYAALRQSSAKPDSGSSPPPPTPTEPISHENSPTDAAAVASSTHPPPVPMNCSSCERPRALMRRASAAAWRRRRNSSGCSRSGAIADQPTVREDVRTRRARATRTPENMVASAAPNSPRIAPGCFTSSSRMDRRIASGRKLSQWNGTARGRRVRQAAMQGRGTSGAGVAATRARPSVVGRPCDAGGGEPHARRGHDGDAVPGQAGAHAEVEAVVDGRERGIESVERLPDGVPDEDGGRIEAEHVAESVVLALVELVGDDRDAPAEARHGASEAGDPARLVPVHELRTRRPRRIWPSRAWRAALPARRAPARRPRRAARARPPPTRARRAPARPPARPRRTRVAPAATRRGWRRRRHSARVPRRPPARARPRARRVCAPAHGSRRGCAGDGRRRDERRGRR